MIDYTLERQSRHQLSSAIQAPACNLAALPIDVPDRPKSPPACKSLHPAKKAQKQRALPLHTTKTWEYYITRRMLIIRTISAQETFGRQCGKRAGRLNIGIPGVFKGSPASRESRSARTQTYPVGNTDQKGLRFSQEESPNVTPPVCHSAISSPIW